MRILFIRPTITFFSSDIGRRAGIAIFRENHPGPADCLARWVRSPALSLLPTRVARGIRISSRSHRSLPRYLQRNLSRYLSRHWSWPVRRIPGGAVAVFTVHFRGAIRPGAAAYFELRAPLKQGMRHLHLFRRFTSLTTNQGKFPLNFFRKLGRKAPPQSLIFAAMRMPQNHAAPAKPPAAARKRSSFHDSLSPSLDVACPGAAPAFSLTVPCVSSRARSRAYVSRCSVSPAR